MSFHLINKVADEYRQKNLMTSIAMIRLTVQEINLLLTVTRHLFFVLKHVGYNNDTHTIFQTFCKYQKGI